MRLTYGIVTLPIALFAGCVSTPELENEPAAESSNHSTFDPPSTAAVELAPTFFAITADTRKCASPMCGGWFLTRLNHSSTRCADGTFARSCYTPVLDWSQSKLPEEDQALLLEACSREAGTGAVYAIVRGTFARTNRGMPQFGRFVINEAWIAEGDTRAQGDFVRVYDNGLRCFTSPCPSVTEETLNYPMTTDIAEIDWTPAKLSEEQVSECVERMSKPAGLVVSGDRYSVSGEAGIAAGRSATAAFYRLGTGYE